MTRERDASGRATAREELVGVADAQAFDAEWRAAAERTLPRAGGGGGSGAQQQQQAALPSPLGGWQGQQQWRQQ